MRYINCRSRQEMSNAELLIEEIKTLPAGRVAEVLDFVECHIQGDWVLIYEIDPVARTVTFHHTGSHSDLF